MVNDNDKVADLFNQYIGNYRLLHLLAQGGDALVYLGEHRYLKRLAAIKVLRTVLNDQDKERFLEEARLLANLAHPHIVSVHEFAVAQKINHSGNRKFTEYIPYFVMDFAPGGSLRALCPAGSCLFIDEAIGYIKQIAAALQYAHDNGIIHRDVKPENCLFNEQEEVMLSDFGLALFAPTPGILSTQQMAGTLPYTAPEQLRGKPSFASDQYSLGVIAYEWLCGHRPFEGEEVDLILQHMSSSPPPLRNYNPGIPQAVEEAVLKALEKSPQQRYPSVQAFVRALEHASQWNTSDISPYSHTATKPFDGNTSKKHAIVRPSSPNFAVKPVAFRKTTGLLSEEEIYALPSERTQTASQRRTQELWHWSLPFASGQKPWSVLITGILVFMLILGSSAFYLKTLPIKPHTTVTQSPATALSHLPAIANFTIKPFLIHGMNLVADDTSFEGDHAALGAGQQVVVDFSYPDASASGKSRRVSIFIDALVARSGNNHGYAPMNLYCNGHAIIQNFTIPGEGYQPNETSFQIPPALLVRGKNEMRLLISSNALGEFWLYYMGIDSALPPAPSVTNFTVSPSSSHDMTLIADDTSFEGDHAALGAGQQVVVDFSYPDAPASGKSINANIAIDALVSRLENRDGYAPMNLYCNGHAIIQNFTLPGEGFQPNETSFQIPPVLLVRGKNEIKLLISAKAQSEFWIYSIGIIPGTFY